MDQWPDLFILQTRWEKVSALGLWVLFRLYWLCREDSNRKQEAMELHVLKCGRGSMPKDWSIRHLAFVLLVPYMITGTTQLAKVVLCQKEHMHPLSPYLTPTLPSDIHSQLPHPLYLNRICFTLVNFQNLALCLAYCRCSINTDWSDKKCISGHWACVWEKKQTCWGGQIHAALKVLARIAWKKGKMGNKKKKKKVKDYIHERPNDNYAAQSNYLICI
jgi:hypothetical protein